MPEDINVYLSGRKLYGDDFCIDQITEWFNDEKEGYANLGAKDRDKYYYERHQLDRLHGYKYLGNRRFKKALGIGSAYGDEFIPISKQIGSITILDPSDAFSGINNINGTPCVYKRPNIDGTMSFEDQSFDLITSLGVMHHIPNVSYVMSECFRCLKKGGIMLIRESITSMGDWNKPRLHLTKRERGIPLGIFEEIIKKSGFKIKKRSLCGFPLLPKITCKLGFAIYNNNVLTILDAILSWLFAWNTGYHRVTILEKFGPTSAYFVLAK